MASKRILKELKDLQRDPPTSCSSDVWLMEREKPEDHRDRTTYNGPKIVKK